MLAPGTESILALVSGLAPGVRERRLLLMLQAYFDESGTGSGPILVLAGFLASAEQWSAFSTDWKRALDMNPAIRYLKMREAAGLGGEFQDWSEDRRNERMSLFYRIIEEHIPIAIWASMPRDAFTKVFAPVADKHTIYRNPYYILMVDMIAQFAKTKDKLGLTERVDFIFDEGAAQVSKITEIWEFIKGADADPRLKTIMGDFPSFKDDKIVLPLQAADLHAWWRRQRIDEYLTGKPSVNFPFKVKKPMESLNFQWTEQKLRSVFLKMFYEGVPPEVLLKLDLWPWVE